MSIIFDVSGLTEFATRLFSAAGLEADKADAVGRYLVEADLMGHSTHGLALAPWYLQGIRDGPWGSSMLGWQKVARCLADQRGPENCR